MTTKATAQMGGLTSLVEIHRGWCNYCKGNAAWCDNCPKGGCALRDYLQSLKSVAELLACPMSDPNRGKSGEGKFVTISSVRPELIERLRAISPPPERP